MSPVHAPTDHAFGPPGDDPGACGTWDLDPQAERVRYSPEFKRRLGADTGEAYDPTHWWRSRVHPDDLLPMREALKAHIDGRSAEYRMRFRLRAAHGGYRWVLSAGQAAARGRDGRALRVLGTMTDLSALHERALHHARTELLASLQHELRTPLNTVLGFAQLLQGQLGSGHLEQQRRHLAHIEQGGWQLLDCFERLLQPGAPAQPSAERGDGDDGRLGGKSGGGSRSSS